MSSRDEPKPRWVHGDGFPYDDLDRGHTRWVDAADLDDRRSSLMAETPLEAARRELAELYKRLALVRPVSRERVRLHMEIARVRKRIAELEREGESQTPT